ncbi:MAG TPA: hypothetical protein VD970_00775 [Acetobacteraceae bacterium]|nr:hypothetical protein [Acetobacteraceae bacterium]
MRCLAGVLGLILVASVLGATAARAAECDCTHLQALQAELRNALRLQARFREAAMSLRSRGTEESRGAFRQFAEGPATQGLEAVPGRGPAHVDYVAYGEGVAEDQLDTLAPGQTREGRQAQLCAMRQSSLDMLNAAMRAAACDGIARAIEAHERHHVAMCGRIGYRAYIAMHGADRAAEEAEAYGVQIAMLRAEILRILERLNPRILGTVATRITPPRNPAWSAIVTDSQMEIVATRVTVVDAAAGIVRFDGQGQQVYNAQVQGNCRITSGMPMTIRATGEIETDGLEARIRFGVDGTIPSFSMQCAIPGAGRGSGFSIPVPASGGPEAFNLPLRDGVDHVVPLTALAASLAAGGIQMSGEARVRLVLNCPAR